MFYSWLYIKYIPLHQANPMINSHLNVLSYHNIIEFIYHNIIKFSLVSSLKGIFPNVYYGSGAWAKSAKKFDITVVPLHFKKPDMKVCGGVISVRCGKNHNPNYQLVRPFSSSAPPVLWFRLRSLADFPKR